MRHCQIAIVAGVLWLAAPGIMADDTRQVPLGTRLRITLPERRERLVGALLALDDVKLTLQAPDRVLVLNRDEIMKTEISAGHRSRGRGALLGAAIGGGAGLVIGAVAGASAGDNSNESELGALEGATVSALLLAPVGALIGLVVPPAERWADLPLGNVRVSIAATRGRGGAVLVTLAF